MPTSHRLRSSSQHSQRQDDYSSHEEGENIYLEDVNGASYAAAVGGDPSLVPEMDNFRYVVHGATNSEIDNFLEHSTEGSLMYSAVSSGASIRTNPLTV